MAEANDIGYELEWDGEIEKDGLEFVLLPNGEYPFTVISMTREYHTQKAGGKLPSCKQVTLDIEFDGGALGVCTIKHKLFLHSTTEGFLSAFFASIGLKKPGERLKMNWGPVPYSKGRAKLKVRRYTKEGEERAINEVDQFLAFDPAKMGAPVAGYVPQPPAAYPPQQGYAAPAYQQLTYQPAPQPNYAPPAQQQGYPPQATYAPPGNYNPPAQQQQAPAQPGFPTQPPAGMPPQTAVPGFESGRF